MTPPPYVLYDTVTYPFLKPDCSHQPTMRVLGAQGDGGMIELARRST